MRLHIYIPYVLICWLALLVEKKIIGGTACPYQDVVKGLKESHLSCQYRHVFGPFLQHNREQARLKEAWDVMGCPMPN